MLSEVFVELVQRVVERPVGVSPIDTYAEGSCSATLLQASRPRWRTPRAALKLQPCQMVRPVFPGQDHVSERECAQAVNGVVAHLGKLGGKSEGALPGVPGLAITDDAKLDRIMTSTQFGYCTQKPILGRTVGLDANVKRIMPVEGDDQRVSCLRTECRPGTNGALGSCR